MLACHRTSPDPLLGGRLSYEETGAGGGRQPGDEEAFWAAEKQIDNTRASAEEAGYGT